MLRTNKWHEKRITWFEAPLFEVRENILSKAKNAHFANNVPTLKSKTALYILYTHICGYAILSAENGLIDQYCYRKLVLFIRFKIVDV